MVDLTKDDSADKTRLTRVDEADDCPFPLKNDVLPGVNSWIADREMEVLLQDDKVFEQVISTFKVKDPDWKLERPIPKTRKGIIKMMTGEENILALSMYDVYRTIKMERYSFSRTKKSGEDRVQIVRQINGNDSPRVGQMEAKIAPLYATMEAAFENYLQYLQRYERVLDKLTAYAREHSSLEGAISGESIRRAMREEFPTAEDFRKFTQDIENANEQYEKTVVKFLEVVDGPRISRDDDDKEHPFLDAFGAMWDMLRDKKAERLEARVQAIYGKN